MTLMRNGEIIALVKKEKNLFILDLIYPGKAMVTINPKVIVIIGWEWPTYPMSQNQQICLWY